MTKVRITPLGGLGEIGKNMMAIECGDDLIVIDAGLAFPEDDMPGIDIVIPEMTYLLERRERIRGVFLTHGHEDHIGAVPYLLRDMSVPLFGTRLTLGLVRGKLQEHGMELPPGSRTIAPGEPVRSGVFEVQAFRVNHSIPDSVGYAIRTPAGTIIHTGDFKFDYTPVDGEVADLDRLAAFGRDGVLLLLADSTNVERPGHTPSERSVGRVIRSIVREAEGRVVVATFASNVHRIQEVFDAAAAAGRRVAVVGRSMEDVVQVAIELGYLKFAEGTYIPVEQANRLPPEKVVVLTTGSQGEPTSALARMATGEHRQVEILPGDTVILAATPVPGNEKSVHRTIDNLYRLGARVVYQRDAGVHVSGHASREELKLMHQLVRPRWFIPIHGEYRHLVQHAELAREMGMPAERILTGENGTVFEVTPEEARVAGRVPAGKVLVDGLGVGDVGSVVLRDRRQLAQDGILVVVMAIDKNQGTLVAGPDIVSRGFVLARESDRLLEEARARVLSAVARWDSKGYDWSAIKGVVRDALGQLIYERTRRRPMVLPIVLEV